MAAIYAFLPITRVYLTSKPYPLLGEDALDEEIDITHAYGVLWSPEEFQEEMACVAGNLYESIQYIDLEQGPEEFTEEMFLVGATLVQSIDYYIYDQGPEEFVEEFSLQNATLVKTIDYIYIEQPPDNVVEEFEVISATVIPI